MSNSETCDVPLDARQHGGNVVCGTPSVLEDIETELAGGVVVWVEHLADELDDQTVERARRRCASGARNESVYAEQYQH